MSVSPPTQPTFVVGARYAAPVTVLDAAGATIASPVGLAASADNAAVSVSISDGQLLAEISTAGITSVITVTIPGADGAMISATVTVSDGVIAAQVPASIAIGLFAPVPTAA
jgi:hypothetical protein